jgi:DNA-binding NtrC family response regulator
LKGTILLVDDNGEFLDSTKDVLEDEGYEVFTATNGEDAVRMVGERPFEVVLMDIKMPGLSGVETLIEIKKINPGVKVIMVTAYSVESLIRQALKEGAYSYLAKPLDMIKLIGLIKHIDNAKKNGTYKKPVGEQL